MRLLGALKLDYGFQKLAGAFIKENTICKVYIKTLNVYNNISFPTVLLPLPYDRHQCHHKG